jgi:uncharacterized protein
MKNLSIIILLLSVSVLFSGCRKDENHNNGSDPSEPADPFDSFDRKGMLQNIGEKVIVPSFAELDKSAEKLSSAAAEFAGNPDNTHLEIVQNAWKETAIAWKNSELFAFGPYKELVNNIYPNIEYPINKAGIENLLKGNTSLNSDRIENAGADLKGLFALEYLLFSKNEGNSGVLNRYSGDTLTAGRRRQYVRLLSENLKVKTESLKNAWLAGGGNYISTFVSADGKDINSSLGTIINQMVYLMELVRMEKVGKPLGAMNGGTPQPEMAEAAESGNSLVFIRKNIESVENTFRGYGQSGDGKGLDDLLDHLQVKKDGELLSVQIKNQFQKVYKSLNDITLPLDQAVVTDQSHATALYNELKILLVLFKTDVVSSTGVLLTISDNDGD